MSVTASNRFSRSLEASQKRASYRNQHLCRMLDNEMKKINDEMRTSRKTLSQEIFDLRSDIIAQKMEMWDLGRKPSFAQCENLKSPSRTKRSLVRCQSSPQLHCRRSTVDRCSSSWAGIRRPGSRKHSMARPQTAQTYSRGETYQKLPLLRSTSELNFRRYSSTTQDTGTPVVGRYEPDAASERRLSKTPTLRAASAWDRRQIHYSVRFDSNDNLVDQETILPKRRVSVPAFVALSSRQRRRAASSNGLPRSTSDASEGRQSVYAHEVINEEVFA